MTIAGAIEACRRRLRGTSETPWLDARILASYVTGLDASAVVAYGDNSIARDRCERLFALAERRAAGEPVAYLVGYKEFCGVRIDVDRRVLVPRPETEELVAAVVADLRGRDVEVLELGTGSGAIACALAQALPRALILATDVDRQAIAVARSNVERLALGERIELALGDLFEAVKQGRRFDAIVANLPYVGERDTAALDNGVAQFEPHRALFGGQDGLLHYRRFLADAQRWLKPDGAAYLECSPFNAAELARAASDVLAHARVEIRNDASGLARFIVARNGAERA
jgi:release factor glutamine methyltransferase